MLDDACSQAVTPLLFRSCRTVMQLIKHYAVDLPFLVRVLDVNGILMPGKPGK